MDNEQLVFLKEQIAERVDGINKRRIHYRRKAFRVFVATTFLSALSTVLLGLKLEGFTETTRVVVLILSTTISVLSTFNIYFNYKELWISNNEALNAFYGLRFSLDFRLKKEDPVTPDELKEYKDSYQKILDILNQAWYKGKINDHK